MPNAGANLESLDAITLPILRPRSCPSPSLNPYPVEMSARAARATLNAAALFAMTHGFLSMTNLISRSACSRPDILSDVQLTVDHGHRRRRVAAVSAWRAVAVPYYVVVCGFSPPATCWPPAALLLTCLFRLALAWLTTLFALQESIFTVPGKVAHCPLQPLDAHRRCMF